MAWKRKRERVPRSFHHPSQSSVAVPLSTKEEVKMLSDGKCWLCNRKADKSLRPLEICHLYPQATSKRFLFERHHECSRMNIYNIHDKANLIALCSICHYAFDNEEWTFIPDDTETWLKSVESTPQIIQEYNSQRAVVFRRLLLQSDRDSKAFQDNDYKKAFIETPKKLWSGEPGVLIMRPAIYYCPPNAVFREALDNYNALRDLWFKYESPCSREQCPIFLQGEPEDTDDDGGDEDDEGNEGDGGEDEEDEEDDEENEDNKEDSYEDSEEEEEGDEDVSSSRKSRKGISKRQPDSASLQNSSTSKRAKKPKHKERDWMTSAPYDESVPYSHRYGYTWAGTTSNELMQLWQTNRKPGFK